MEVDDDRLMDLLSTPCGRCPILEAEIAQLKALLHNPEKLAQKFHETYERLAPEYSYKTRKASAVPWADVPENNKKLMVAVCKEIARDVLKETPEAVNE